MVLIKNRNIKIDIIKGLAVYFVLWGHFIQYTSADTFDFFDNSMFKFIYSFHMPLFAIISGYLFFGTLQRKNLKEVIISRVVGIIIPIIVWTTIIWIEFAIVKKDIGLNKWWSIFTGAELWFLWSILASSIVIAIIVKLVPKKIKIITLLLGIFVMYFFPNPEMNLYMYPFILLGYYGNEYKERLKKYNSRIIRLIILLLFMILLMFFNKECYIYTTGIIHYGVLK